MTCATCGTENAPGAKFCMECAARLVAICPACGSQNAPNAKFCSECATPLAAPPAAPASAPGPFAPLAALGRGAGPAPVAERRLVSILFADLVGFTTLADGRDPEETRDLLSRYFDLARDVVGRHGGVIEKFIGDAVMAVWGAPTAQEDDAERAVRAGLELVDAVETLGPELQARAGVLTGEAAVTLGAVGQGMVAGDLVNTASRLQSAAAPGTVLAGEATVRAADRAIAFEAAGEQALKGKAAPVSAWRAVRVVAERGGRNRSETLEAPFVGRETELRLLKDLFHATSGEGRARLVSVIGPAGIGKTRLAWEFLKYADGLVDRVWWHDGRSPAYGDGITFWALGEMVRGRCGLVETDDEATTRAKVADVLARHVPDESERRWIEPALLALLGIESGIATEQLFGAWRMFFERLAVSAPVVLVFEDFHYADSGLLDFVDSLLEWSRNSPIYVLTLSRPELLEKRSDWGAAKRSFTSLYLEPLPAVAMHELLAGLVPGLPGPAAQAIVGRADGIPLYAVETIRMLVAEGRLRPEADSYVPVGDLTDLAVPETLTALIASRLDGLPPTDRALVSDAAVLGQSFTLAGLAAVSGLEDAELEPRLRTLVRREILQLEVDPRSPERGQYAFVQALIREVAYNTLARPDRKARHLAAARYFEALGSDELAGALAGHYLAAQANAPEGPERDALAGQARLAFRGAAERAVALAAHDQAVTFLDQALSVTTEPAERAGLLDLAGDERAAGGHYAAAQASFDAALDLRREIPDRPAFAATLTRMTRAMLSGRQARSAIPLLEPAVVELADVSADPAVVGLRAQLARAYMLVDESRRAIETVDPVLEEAERQALTPILADALVTRGTSLQSLGRVIEGLGVIEIGERLARAHDLTWTVLRAMNNRVAFIEEGGLGFDSRVYAEASREAMALARRIGDRGWMNTFTFHLGYALWHSGEWDAALEVWAEALAESPEPGDRIGLVQGASLVHAARGEPIRDLMVELEQLESGVSDPQVLWIAADGRAFAAFAAGRLDEAERRWRDAARDFAWRAPTFLWSAGEAAMSRRDAIAARSALAGLDATGFHTSIMEFRRRSLRSGLAALEDRTEEAVRGYRTVIDGLGDAGLPFQAALVAISMATVLGGDRAEVRAAVAEARTTLTRLRARPFLERLEAAAGIDGGKEPEAVPGATAVAPATPATTAVTEAPA